MIEKTERIKPTELKIILKASCTCPNCYSENIISSFNGEWNYFIKIQQNTAKCVLCEHEIKLSKMVCLKGG